MSWMFVLALAVVLVGFLVAWRTVKSGRLTVYMLALDVALINMEPVFTAVTGYDFAAILTAKQQGWLVLAATGLAAVARKRKTFRRHFEEVASGPL